VNAEQWPPVPEDIAEYVEDSHAVVSDHPAWRVRADDFNQLAQALASGGNVRAVHRAAETLVVNACADYDEKQRTAVDRAVRTARLLGWTKGDPS
jgi:hypothetical protein